MTPPATISCKKCPFAFPGDVVCLSCATGFRLERSGSRHLLGERERLVKVFSMQTERIDGKVHCQVSSVCEPTDLYVTVVSRPFASHGLEGEVPHVPVEEFACPCCGEHGLRHNFNNPERCPQCGSQSLYRSVIFAESQGDVE